MTQLIYDRQAVVQYAETWWNRYNPAFPQFTVDCTNFVSQCVRAGGAPLRGIPNKLNGWWYKANNWSLSWSVAHSLYWYLMESKTGLVRSEERRVGKECRSRRYQTHLINKEVERKKSEM